MLLLVENRCELSLLEDIISELEISIIKLLVGGAKNNDHLLELYDKSNTFFYIRNRFIDNEELLKQINIASTFDFRLN